MCRRSSSSKGKQNCHSPLFMKRWPEFLSGVVKLFEMTVGRILLYRFERHQYLSLRRTHNHRKVAELFGTEHLLRLFGMQSSSLPCLTHQ